MSTIVIMGKRVSTASPLVEYPGALLWPVTHVQQRWWKGELTGWHTWWDMHPVEDCPAYPGGIKGRRPATWAWYRTLTADQPVMMLDVHPLVAGSRRFPLEEVEQVFTDEEGDGRLWTCQVDYMLAYAILMRPRLIVLDGIGMISESHYQVNHIGIGYWIGIARGYGIQVRVSPDSTYHAPARRYGYEAAPRRRMSIR